LAECKSQFEELHTYMKIILGKPINSTGRGNRIQQTRTNLLIAVVDDCQTLCSRLQDLAGEALQCGCERNVPGAMEVFQESTTTIELVSELLRRCQEILPMDYQKPENEQLSPMKQSSAQMRPGGLVMDKFNCFQGLFRASAHRQGNYRSRSVDTGRKYY